MEEEDDDVEDADEGEMGFDDVVVAAAGAALSSVRANEADTSDRPLVPESGRDEDEEDDAAATPVKGRRDRDTRALCIDDDGGLW